MIEVIKEILDKVYLRSLPDDAALCGFDSKDLQEAPVVELEAE